MHDGLYLLWQMTRGWMAEKAASFSGSYRPCLDPVQAAASLLLCLCCLMAWAGVALQQHTSVSQSSNSVSQNALLL